MPIKDVPDHYKNPSLRRWRVKEVVLQNGTRSRHVYGHDVANDAGRSSTAIKKFDPKTMTATTQSGRTYKLAGAPGHTNSGEYTWQIWCDNHGVVSEVDVTHEYFDENQLFTKGSPSFEITK